MRTNLPITNQEYFLRDGMIIVSKTDLRGCITYVNDGFIEASGFTEAELIGQPHNMVRHPDMPSEAFKDFWACLSAGRPWSGYVKNRCKNGDHYWVLANACPIFEDGRVTGYMSVREKASRDMVDAHEKAYAAIRAGKSGLVVQDGQALADNKLKLAWRKVTLAQRLYAVCSLLIIGLLMQAGLGILNVNQLNNQASEIKSQRVIPLQQIKSVADAYAVSIVDLAHKTRDGTEPWSSALGKVEAAELLIRKEWGSYIGTSLPPEERQLADQATEMMKASAAVTSRLKELIRSQDKSGLTAFAAQELYPVIDPISDKLSALVALQVQESEKLVELIHSESETTVVELAIIAGIFAVFGLLLTRMMATAIRRPIDEAAGYFRRFAEGKLDVQIKIGQRDEVSKVLEAAKTMQVKLGFDISEQKRVADEMTRIKIALDNVSTGVMIANAGREIIYANNSVKRILKGAEAAIKKQLPNFDADNMIGVNIDTFHKNPKHQADLLSSFSSTYVANLEISDRHLRVTASPVFNNQGARLGAVAEWMDRTQEVKVENEVAALVTSASQGDFTQQLDTQGKDGFFLTLAGGLNELMATADKGLKDVVRVLGALAEGDLTQRIEDDYQGTFGQLKDYANETASSLSRMLGQIREAADTIYTAAGEISAGNTDLSSRTEEQASSLEETASSMEQITSTVKLNADNARQANSLSVNASEVAIDGGAVVEQVVRTMSSINESSRKISDIISVIDGIAFQTNILALNAAVEAARAGEQGRGFAVVAGEVRNLAQRSAAAAKEIKSLISDSVEKVDNGNQLVAQAGKTMSEIVTAIKRVTDIMAEIAAASAEQSTGIEEINGAVGQMDEMTQQNAALVEQAAASAESLLEQASVMSQAVAVFKFDQSNTQASPPPRKALPRQTSVQQTSARATPMRSLPKSKDDEWEEF